MKRNSSKIRKAVIPAAVPVQRFLAPEDCDLARYQLVPGLASQERVYGIALGDPKLRIILV